MIQTSNSKTINLENLMSNCKEEFSRMDTGKNNETDKYWKCKYATCNRLFKEKGNLKTHLRVHIGDKPFECTYLDCKMKFITQGNLKSHLINHLGIKPFRCDFEGCKQSYINKARLEIHMRTHKGFKPFRCDYEGCKKQFNEKGNLKTHMRCHTNIKPYVCIEKDCGAVFKFSVNLKKHLKTHHDSVNDFYCVYCPNRFSRYATLQTHLKIHEEYLERKDLLHNKTEKSELELDDSKKPEDNLNSFSTSFKTAESSSDLEESSLILNLTEPLEILSSIFNTGNIPKSSDSEDDFYSIARNVRDILDFSTTVRKSVEPKKEKIFSFLNMTNIRLNIASLFNNQS